MFGLTFARVIPKTICQPLVPNNVFSIAVANFSKYISKARKKRLPMTTKRAGKGYYKGNGCRREGILTSKGKFRRMEGWATELVVPDLTGFPLKPYIGVGAKRHIIEANVSLQA